MKPGPRSRSIRDAADLPVWIKNDYAGQPNGYDIGAVQSGLPRVRSAPVKTKKKLLLPLLFGIIGGGVIMMLVIANAGDLSRYYRLDQIADSYRF